MTGTENLVNYQGQKCHGPYKLIYFHHIDRPAYSLLQSKYNAYTHR